MVSYEIHNTRRCLSDDPCTSWDQADCIEHILVLAIENGCKQCFQFLSSELGNCEYNRRNMLHYCCRYNRVDFLKYLLFVLKFDPDQASNNNWMPIHEAASYNHKSCIYWLIVAGANMGETKAGVNIDDIIRGNHGLKETISEEELETFQLLSSYVYDCKDMMN